MMKSNVQKAMRDRYYWLDYQVRTRILTQMLHDRCYFDELS